MSKDFTSVGSSLDKKLQLRHTPLTKKIDDFVLKITGEECEGVLLHEGYHVILLHHIRMGNRNHKLWNIACDYAINNYIYDHTDFELPEGGLWDEKYDHMTAEKI